MGGSLLLPLSQAVRCMKPPPSHQEQNKGEKGMLISPSWCSSNMATLTISFSFFTDSMTCWCQVDSVGVLVQIYIKVLRSISDMTRLGLLHRVRLIFCESLWKVWVAKFNDRHNPKMMLCNTTMVAGSRVTARCCSVRGHRRPGRLDYGSEVKERWWDHTSTHSMRRAYK